MKTTTRIKGIDYKKSLHSRDGGGHCVGVALKNKKILVINTKTEGPTTEFTMNEWIAFIKGVKDGEFDPHCLPKA